MDLRWELRDKVILVVGGEGLLGKAICQGLSRQMARIVSADLALKGSRWRKRASFCHLDICSESSVKTLLKEIEARYGCLDVVVNATYPKGIGYGKGFWEMTTEEMVTSFALHAGGSFRLTQAVARHMVQRRARGSIILFGSIYGVVSPDFRIYAGTRMISPPDYAFIKGGIIQFTRYLAALLAEQRIRVNCISPGGVHARQPRSFRRQYTRRNPMGRMAIPADVVGAVAFLASEASAYVTGQNLVIDGGWTVI